MYFLYVKTHRTTGLKYLGFTKQNPEKYNGSGLYWTLHIKKHGKNIQTEILFQSESLDDIKKKGIEYSILWNIVESSEWANLKPETGEGGCIKGTNLGRKHTEETKKKISESKIGKPINRIHRVSDSTKKKISESLKGKTRSKSSITNQIESRRKNGTLYHSEETKKKLSKPKSKEFCDKLKNRMIKNHPTKNQFLINNGVEQKYCLGIIPEGWDLGRIIKPFPPSQKGRVWANDGFKNKMVYEIPEGWNKGRI